MTGCGGTSSTALLPRFPFTLTLSRGGERGLMVVVRTTRYANRPDSPFEIDRDQAN